MIDDARTTLSRYWTIYFQCLPALRRCGSSFMHVIVVRVDMLLNGTRISRQDASGGHNGLLTCAPALAALIRVFPILSKLKITRCSSESQPHQKYDDVSHPNIYSTSMHIFIQWIMLW
jgi:hypothetical protein